MDVITALKQDYQRFPQAQTYSVYAEDVQFKDPWIAFRGRDRYQFMIGLMEKFFLNAQMDLHQIQQEGDRIRTDWTLRWNSPLPWKPRISIDGWSELRLNEQGLIASHVDYWNCSKWDVLKQHFQH